MCPSCCDVKQEAVGKQKNRSLAFPTTQKVVQEQFQQAQVLPWVEDPVVFDICASSARDLAKRERERTHRSNRVI